MAVSPRPRRILVLDNAISNGGDAAILLSMQTSLRSVYGEDTEIRVCFCGASSDPGPYAALYPEVCFIRVLWHAEWNAATVCRSIWEKLLRRSIATRFMLQAFLTRHQFPSLFLSAGESHLLRDYQEVDLVVVSGGGFLNTAWTPHNLRSLRIAQYRAALLLGKPLIFYAQSFGPFAPGDPLPLMLRPILRRASGVFCREPLSMQTVRELLGGLPDQAHQTHIHQTMDEAMLLAPCLPTHTLAPPQMRPRRIGICVHQWHWQGAADPDARQRVFEARLATVCIHLLEVEECELVFLTTHQGVPKYHQDASVSWRIHAQIPAILRQYAHVVEDFVPPCEFAGFMGMCDLTLSSRLHGALLSLVGGTPAIALAYEPKTKEIMRELDIAAWTLSMWDSSAAQIVACIHALLADLPAAQCRQQAALARGRALALQNRALLHAILP